MKKLVFNFGGEKLKFETSQSLFSSAKVDSGTKFLLNSLRKDSNISYGKILDVGCGYGALGIFLKKQHNEASVLCIDRDSLATKFCEKNAKSNGVDIETKWTIDYQNIDDRFNLIVSNFPAKAGLNALKKFVYGASQILDDNGIFAVVIVRGLEKNMDAVLNENINVLFKEGAGGYLIYHLSFNKKINFIDNPYFRNNIHFLGYKMDTAYNIDEFEAPSFITELFVDFIKKMKDKNITIVNPNQGHIALAALKFMKPETISLISRDFLSLKFCSNNLAKNNFKGFKILENNIKKSDIVIWNVNGDEEFELFERRLNEFSNHSNRILIGGKSSILHKFLEKCERKILDEKTRHGFSVILI